MKTMQNSKKKIRGYAAVEMAIAAGILLFVVGGTCTFMSRAGESWNSVVLRTNVQSHSREAMDHITENLKKAVNIKMDESNPYYDSIFFQVPRVEKDGKVKLGAWKLKDDGKLEFKEHHWHRYMVVVIKDVENETYDARLILLLLDEKGEAKKEYIPVTKNVARPRSGAKAFDVKQVGDLCTIMLLLEKELKGGEGRDTFTYRLESSVMSRNTNINTLVVAPTVETKETVKKVKEIIERIKKKEKDD